MAEASTLALDIQKEISILRKQDNGQWIQSALQRIEDAVNAVAKNGAIAAKGKLPPPPPVQQVSVKASGGLVHVVISDSNEIQKGIHYFVEHDTSPSFPNPQVEALNASRQVKLNLPAMDDNGNPQPVYVRAYSQYPGSDPSSPVHFGGTVPTPVSPGGSVKMTLLPSTGSGTAPNDGQRGGSGFGTVLVRPTAGPKRVIAA